MASENTLQGGRQPRQITSENTAAALQAYQKALAAAPLSAETRRTYLSKVRGYLAWLAVADLEGDPLGERRARDWGGARLPHAPAHHRQACPGNDQQHPRRDR